MKILYMPPVFASPQVAVKVKDFIDHEHREWKIRNHWKPPPVTWLKVNFDASFSHSTNLAGVSIVVHNDSGKFVAAMARVRGARDIDQAEALALLMAAQWIREKGLSKIIVEGDDKGIMEAVQKNHLDNVRWEDKNLLAECVSLFQSMCDIVVQFVPRSCNLVADDLAKYARRNICNQKWHSHPPHILIQSLNKDMYELVSGE
ncbi:uncharacterized protein LOC113328861 [Papaver somniferum]|uniref:uncharacterized protein LOC113328861 n=1 Tax=Papaver somniferum TaxID=3469 RepID=UPI000E704570|nr:uncharacterized protein LOC113328861 [Papaver somniferum]